MRAGTVTAQEGTQKKRYLNSVSRAYITTIAQERNILLATHPALQTLSRAMSTYGRVSSAALSIMNAFNLAQLVTQGQSQQGFELKLKITDVNKEIELLKAEIAKHPDDATLKIKLRFAESEKEELNNQIKALAKEEGNQWISNFVTAIAAGGTAISTAFTAITSSSKATEALITAGKFAGGIFSGFFVFVSNAIMGAAAWIQGIFAKNAFLNKTIAESGTLSGTTFGTAFAIAAGIAISIGLALVYANVVKPWIDDQIDKLLGIGKYATVKTQTRGQAEVKSILGGTGWATGLHKASGFDGIVTGPTPFLAGEAGKERVTISPMGSGRGSGGNTIIQYTIVQGSVLAEREVERISNRALKRDLKRVGFG